MQNLISSKFQLMIFKLKLTYIFYIIIKIYKLFHIKTYEYKIFKKHYALFSLINSERDVNGIHILLGQKS